MGNAIPQEARTIVKYRAGGRCERCATPLLDGEWHHRRGRGVRDRHTHHPCNGVWLCRTCHEEVHAQQVVSRKEGFVVSRHVANPGEIPVVMPYGTLLLGCDGTFNYWIGEDLE